MELTEASSSPAPRSRALEFDWIRKYAAQYPGQWVALRGAELLSHDQDIGHVNAEAAKRAASAEILLYFVPYPEEEV
jgi:hypothetical protein